MQPVCETGVSAPGAAPLPPERVPELRSGTVTDWVTIEARITHLEHLLDVAVEVVARTNGLDPAQIRRLLERDVEDRYGSDSDEDPSPPIPPGDLWPPEPSPPPLKVLIGGRAPR